MGKLRDFLSTPGNNTLADVKAFKPISKLLIKVTYNVNSREEEDCPSAQIQVRLVDGRVGASADIIPRMSLITVSEIATKSEGFQRRSTKEVSNFATSGALNSSSYYSVILGQELPSGRISAIDLSNDKYLDIELSGLPSCHVEIYGLESTIVSSFSRVYRPFYMSGGELEKNFHTGNNESLVVPLEKIRELQLYGKNGTSPIISRDELVLDEDSRNDLITVQLDKNNKCPLPIQLLGGSVIDGTTNVPVEFGFSKWAILDLDGVTSFDIRRDSGVDPLMFLMVDLRPTEPASMKN